MSFLTSGNKLSKKEAQKQLVLIKSYAKGGKTLLSSLKLSKKATTDESVRKILSSSINEIERGNKQEEVLYYYGFVNEIEKEMLSVDNPEGIRDSLEKIKELRSFRNRYEKFILSKVIPPLIMLTIIAFVNLSFGGKMKEFYDSLKKLSPNASEMMKSIDSVVWFYYSPFLLLITTCILIALFFACVFIYNQYENSNKTLIYKWLQIKAIDDMPVLFQIIQNMESSGIQAPKDIMEKLSNFKSFKGLRKLFKDLKNAIIHNEKMHHVFRENHFPNAIVVLIESGEEGGDFFGVLPETIEVSKELSQEVFANMQQKYGTLGYVLAAMVFLYFIASTFIANILYSAQNAMEMMEMMGQLGRM